MNENEFDVHLVVRVRVTDRERLLAKSDVALPHADGDLVAPDDRLRIAMAITRLLVGNSAAVAEQFGFEVQAVPHP